MKIPKAGHKCERIVEAKSHFHPESFRWVKSGSGRILIGCPKTQEGRKTVWDASRRKGAQCRFARSTTTAGTRAHAVITARKSGGACPVGAKRL